jgi:DNA polymerase III alpha subunit (gram-positive type)
MRRCYPKLPSYGLAALCQHFAIELKSHHRAEADATATVALLALIHQAERADVSQPPTAPVDVELGSATA